MLFCVTHGWVLTPSVNKITTTTITDTSAWIMAWLQDIICTYNDIHTKHTSQRTETEDIFHWMDAVQDINGTSHERHGVSSQRQIDCLCNNFSILTTENTPKLRFTAPL